MHLMAQIDLAELAAATGRSPLPAAGSMAFFVGHGNDGGCKIIYVPEARASSPTAPPADMPAAFGPGLYNADFPETAAPTAPRHFPRWPIAFTACAAPPDDGESDVPEVVATEVASRFTGRQYNFSMKAAATTLQGATCPVWWHTAALYAQALEGALVAAPLRLRAKHKMLQDARKYLAKVSPPGPLHALRRVVAGPTDIEKKAAQGVARSEAAIVEFERQQRDFESVLADVQSMTAGRNPWREMRADEIADFDALAARVKTTAKDFARYYVPHGWRDLETDTLKAMATADDAVYRLLPTPIRAFINDNYLLSTNCWHQIFGRPYAIQDSAASLYEDGNILLLQLVHDDMMHWSFGDNGAWYVFMSPDALARRDWDAAKVTFECH